MRVLLLTCDFSDGGLARQLVLLARKLPSEWERRIWSLDGGPYAGPAVEAGVPLRVRRRRSRFDLTPALDLWRAVQAWRPDVLHAWHWMPAAAAVPVSLATGIPLIDGSIRMGSVPRSWGRPRAGIMRFARLVVANSQAGLDAWHIGPAKGRVIRNAFDEERIRERTSRDASSCDAAGPFTVVMAARMEPPKDFLTVVRAARLLHDRCPDRWRFVLLGSGVGRDAVRAEAADLVGAGVVVLPDAGLEVISHLLEAHVGVLMTDPAVLAEGCPNSVMEYMACGLPVVCADSGGCRELVRDGVNGYVVPARDHVALAGRLDYLRGRRDVARRLGTAGRARVEEELTVEVMVRKYLDAYEDAMSAVRGR